MAKDDQYRQIYQLWKNERRTTEVLEVKGSMYSTIRQNITTLEKELEGLDPKDKASRKIIINRVDRLNKILRDMMKIRMHKIIHTLINKSLNQKGLAAEELDLVKSLERIFEEHQKRAVFGEATIDVCIESGVDKDKETLTHQLNFMVIRILEDIPEIVDATTNGVSTKSFGPFKKEDIVKLPLVYAKALIMKNAADRVDLPEL